MAILLLPNYGSFLGRQYLSAFAQWGNLLVLNTSWNFFSPDPAHIMYFEYQYTNLDASQSRGVFPPEGVMGTRDLRHRRDLYMMRYLALDPARIQNLLGPWLCRQNPQANDMHLTHYVKLIKPLEKSLLDADGRFPSEFQTFESDFVCANRQAQL